MRCTVKSVLATTALTAIVVAGSTAVRAETDTVNMAQQFGLLYVPLHVVMDQKLIQKHAKKMGIKVPKIKMYKISGGANINKALLANTLDFGAMASAPRSSCGARPMASSKSRSRWPTCL